MKYLLLVICAFLLVSVNSNTISPDILIQTINSQNSTWKAGLNFPKESHTQYTQQRVGFLKSHPDSSYRLEKKIYRTSITSIPDSFDLRDRWPNCSDIIGHIRDQGNCRSSWVFAPTEVMSDRLCIASHGRMKFEFSTEDVMSCCGVASGWYSCALFNKSDTCDGGYLIATWDYWKTEGIVSGGDYNSNKGCKPYGALPYLNHTTPSCSRSCTNLNYENTYSEDRQSGFNYYLVTEDGDVAQMQAELLSYGSLQVNFTVYEDFSYYKEGVYQHIEGDEIGGLYLKIIGWGIEDDIPYWLAANSWGTNWGNLNGFVKIRRGFNECGIESFVIVGTPIYEDPVTTPSTTTTTIAPTTEAHGSAMQLSSRFVLLISYVLLLLISIPNNDEHNFLCFFM